jgi:hypothetical protein
MYCPNCGTKCEEIHRFCFRCGFALPSVAFAASAEEAPVSATPLPEQAPPTIAPAEIPAADPSPAEPSAAEPLLTDCATEHSAAPSAENETESTPELPPEVPAALPINATHNPPPLQIPDEPSPAPASSPTPKGSLWAPAVVLCAMMAIGLMLYFLFPTISPDDTNPSETDEAACFTVSNGVLTFHSKYYSGGSELVIPEIIDGQTVTGIAKDCFLNCTELTSVILPETLTEIHDHAFSGCTNLRGIFIPEGVIRIGDGAFTDCTALEAIHLPSSLRFLNRRAIVRCPKLTHIFYAGTYASWEELFSGSLPKDAWIYCEDGKFPSQR